jgi:hypothetical protein
MFITRGGLQKEIGKKHYRINSKVKESPVLSNVAWWIFLNVSKESSMFIVKSRVCCEG